MFLNFEVWLVQKIINTARGSLDSREVALILTNLVKKIFLCFTKSYTAMLGKCLLLHLLQVPTKENSCFQAKVEVTALSSSGNGFFFLF